ncbi:MAG: hypothetical protein ACJ77K_05785 [Bacteroidia bacterium]
MRVPAFIFAAMMFTSLCCSAQDGLGYYHDQNNDFFVFDNGIEHRLEEDPVTNVVSGSDWLAYTDYKQSFMYYYQGDKQLLEENYPNKIVATKTALVYKMQLRLMMCQKGEKKMLSRNAPVFAANDSIVMWQEWPSMDYIVYENGTKSTMITAINSSDMISDYQLGSNIVAYNDLNYHLNIWYKGKTYETQTVRAASYACGHNIVAWIDQYKNTLNIFYDGEQKVISTEIIKEYHVTNDMVTYLDDKDNFFVFYMGGVTKIDSRKPDYYFSRGNVLYYSYNSANMKIVYEGHIYTQNLVDPGSIVASDNGLLFYSDVNQPKYFYKGKVIDRFYVPKPYTMQLNSDLPVFFYSNSIGFLFNGKISEYGIKNNSGSY